MCADTHSNPFDTTPQGEPQTNSNLIRYEHMRHYRAQFMAYSSDYDKTTQTGTTRPWQDIEFNHQREFTERQDAVAVVETAMLLMTDDYWHYEFRVVKYESIVSETVDWPFAAARTDAGREGVE